MKSENIPIAKILHSSKPHSLNNGPENLIDGNTKTYWDGHPPERQFNNWSVTFELVKSYAVLSVNLVNWGDDDTHDVTSFKLQASDDQVIWFDAGSVNDVEHGSSEWQRFDGFKAIGKYMKFTVTQTHSGWQPWVREISFTGHSGKYTDIEDQILGQSFRSYKVKLY